MEREMRKVLVVANLADSFPRITNIAYHLPECGWQPYLLTPLLRQDAKARFNLPDDFFRRVRLLEVPVDSDIFYFYRRIFYSLGIKKNRSISDQLKSGVGAGRSSGIVDFFLQAYQAVAGFPDTQHMWIGPALKMAAGFAEEKFDLILSSHPHASVNVIASKLQKRFNIPWVADFRDLWSQNHNYLMPSWRRWVDRLYEKKTLCNAAAVVTVSDGFARKQQQFLGREILVITNGFGRDTITDGSVVPTRKFTVTYCGTLYPKVQNPLKFFKPLCELVSSGEICKSDLDIRFIGTDSSFLEKIAEDCGVSSAVTFIPRLPRAELFVKQRESQVLLMFNWEDPDSPGVYALKLFEYLAAKRPILATGGYPEDDVSGIIAKADAGVFAPSHNSVKDSLRAMYIQYKRDGAVSYSGIDEEIRRYSYDKLAAQYGSLFENVLKA